MQWLKHLWIDEDGAILSSETILIGSTLVIGSVVGLTSLRNSVVQELDDVAKAIGSIDQSYSYSGVWGHCAFTAGSAFYDRADFCDDTRAVICQQTCTAVVSSHGYAYSTHAAPVVGHPVAAPPVGAVVDAPVHATHPAGSVAVSAPVPVAYQGTVVLGARGLMPLGMAVAPHQPLVRVFLDPTRPGTAIVEAPEGAWNQAVWPQMQVFVAHPGGYIDAGCCYGPVPGFVHQAVPLVKTDGGRIELGFTSVGNSELRNLKGMKGVTSLHVLGTDVTDDGLAHLQGLVNLEALFLIGTKVTDAGLEHLAGLVKLEALHLVGAGITDAGLEHLKKLEALRVLDIRGTQVTHEGILALQQALPHLQVIR